MVRLFVSLSLIFVGSAAFAVELPDDCMPLSEVKVGMIGEARSVVSGFEIEPFKVEIMGVEKGALPGGAMILARMEGKYLENHGIVAGMSGSPVYINGKIIGAVAYGWTFAYRPYAGITPIEDMLTVWNKIDEFKPGPKAKGKLAGYRGTPSGASAAMGWDWQADWEAYQQRNGLGAAAPEPVSFRPTSPELVKAFGTEPIEMVPLTAPIFVSGASSRTMTQLQNFFGSRGLSLFPAGASGGSNEDPEKPSPDIEAGSAIGVPIMTGDMTVSSIGTVTYRQGDKLIAFGHPMFFEGPSNAPMAKARIFGTMQSYNRSFKLGESREIVGMIRQDRQFGIGGVFGDAPERVDVKVRVHGDGVSHPREYKFSIWESPDFLPQLAGIAAIQESFSGSAAQGGELTLECSYDIGLADGRHIKKRLTESSQFASTVPFSLSLIRDLFMLLNNPYEQVDLESVTLDLRATPGFRIDSLVKAVPRYGRVEPGDKLEIDTLWQPFRGEKYNRRISVTIPKDIRPGSYVVHVADADTATRIDQRHEPASFMPLDIDETVEVAQRIDYPTDHLKIYLLAPQIGVSLRSDSLEGIPSSIQTLMESTAAPEIQNPVMGHVLSIDETRFDYPIVARASFAIDVVSYIEQ